MMRILMVGDGGAIALRRVIDWVCGQGHQVCLVAQCNPYLQPMPPTLRFVHCAINNEQMAVDLTTERTDMAALTASVVNLLQRVAAEFQPDVVHVHHLNILTDCCVKAGLRPLVVSAWGMLNHLLGENETDVHHEALRRMLANADGLIVESPALFDYCRRLQVCPPQVALIPLGCNPRRFQPTPADQRRLQRRLLGIPADCVVLLSPRGWGKLYQHEQIFAAYQLAYPHFTRPTLLCFLKLGRNGQSNEAEQLCAVVQQAAADGGLTAAVRWLPALLYEMMPTIYQMADVVVNFPSTDAFPSTLVEAMACECPVISTRLPSYRGTLIEDFCTLVEPTAPDEAPVALAQAMIDLVKGCPQQRQPRLQAARQAVVDHYDEMPAQRALFALYETVRQ